jgi:SUMO ligase MMS21 Smc5/6 complex component
MGAQALHTYHANTIALQPIYRQTNPPNKTQFLTNIKLRHALAVVMNCVLWGAFVG